MNLNDSMCNSECFKSAPSMNRWILWSGRLGRWLGTAQRQRGTILVVSGAPRSA